jgi:hypothetical protein
MKPNHVKFKKWTCNVQVERYPNDRVALRLTDVEDGGPVATASVNIPEASIESDEVIIKSWSENEGMADALIEGNIISPAIGSMRTAYVVGTVHKLLI